MLAEKEQDQKVAHIALRRVRQLSAALSKVQCIGAAELYC